MKILIVSTQLPFVSGGAEIQEKNLKKALIENGFEAEITKIGFTGNRIKDQILASRLLDFTSSAGSDIDRVIGLKFPAYYVKHHNKVLWILHQLNNVYDYWGTKYQGIPSNSTGERLREIIINCDNQFLPEAKKIYTVSKNVSKKLKKFNNIESVPLYHPPDDAEKFYEGTFDDYFFIPSRIAKQKRQDLIVKAMNYTKTNVKMVLAGRPDNINEIENLKEIIEKNNLQSKVTLLENVSGQKKFDLYANSLGTVFVPFEESYGYVTLESFYSKKPVITTNDSGGPLEFVNHKENGYIVSPEPKEIAFYMDELYRDKNKAKKLGTNGFNKINSLQLSWDTVVKELTT